MAINWNGLTLIQPQARTVLNTSALTPAAPAQPVPHTLVLIGPANQGPNALTPIASVSDIQTTLGIDSDLANAAALALNAAPSAAPASPLQVWNVNPTTTGTVTLPNGGTSPTTQITATTTRFGQAANLIAVTVSVGATSGYTITVQDDYSGQAITLANVGLTPLSLAYTGTAYTDVTVTVTDTSLTLSGTASGATSATTITDLSLSTYSTVQQVANQLNQITDLTATVLDPNPQDPTPALFDNVSAVPVSSTAVTLTANVTAVVRALNGSSQPWITDASRAANATGLATAGTPIYATGGSTGAATTSDWQAAYTALQTQTDVLWVVPVSSESTIWAMNAAHCAYMANEGYLRLGYVGGALGTTVSEALSNAAGLVNPYTAYLVAGVQGTNLQGHATTFPASVVAAQLAGAHSGLPLNQSLTLNVPLTATGLEQTFAPAVLDQLIQGGCVVLKPYNGAFVVAKDQTTAALNPIATVLQVQTQAIAEVAVLTYGLNVVLNAFVGQPITATTAAQVQTAVYNYLQAQAQGSNALIQTAPAMGDITVTITGTVITVQAPATPVVAADFVLTTLAASVDTAAA